MDEPIAFAFDQRVARRAARELWVTTGRRLLDLSTLGWMAVASGLLAWFIVRKASWGWLVLGGAGPAIWLAGVVSWVVWGVWLRREMAARREGITGPTVYLWARPLELEVRTERERITLRWSDVTRVHWLPSFIVLHFRGGSRIPLPLEAVPDDVLDVILSKARQAGAAVDGNRRS